MVGFSVKNVNRRKNVQIVTGLLFQLLWQVWNKLLSPCYKVGDGIPHSTFRTDLTWTISLNEFTLAKTIQITIANFTLIEASSFPKPKWIENKNPACE